jgi:hypothetical protein
MGATVAGNHARAGHQVGEDVAMTIEPDTKDWTWVLTKRCADCGFDAATVPGSALPRLIRENAVAWQPVLAAADAAVRPADNVWSPLEYACHVRDVHRVFERRVAQMLTEDDPEFESWDQDATAVEQRYGEQDPSVVAVELVEAAEVAAARYAAVVGDQWRRPGSRSDGAVFTVESLGRYHLHDSVHHRHDVHG